MRSRWLDGLVFWTPRLVCIAFAAFLCVFALDVFDMPLPPLQKFAAFVIHLVPAAIVAAGLIVVWSHEWVGAAFFPLLALVHFLTRGRGTDPVATLLVEVPLVLLGVLFWVNWQHRSQKAPPLPGNGGRPPVV